VPRERSSSDAARDRMANQLNRQQLNGVAPGAAAAPTPQR
jgi:hypothetical protein